MGKPNYTKPTSQVDLEARQSKDYVSPAQLVKGTYPQPSENGYVSVDPIYQNFANDTEKPYRAEKGAEAKVEETAYADEVNFDAGATAEGVSDAQEDAGSSKSSGTTTASGAATSGPPTGPTSPSNPTS